MVTHVLRELKFAELCNLGICGDQGFPKVVREIMVDILGGEPFLMYANLMDFSFASLLCCVLMYDYLSIYLYPFFYFFIFMVRLLHEGGLASLLWDSVECGLYISVMVFCGTVRC